MKTPQNLSGPRIAKRREELGWTRARLVAECHERHAVEISEDALAEMEEQVRPVLDFELRAIGKALGVPGEILCFPEDEIPQWLQDKYRS